MESPSLDHRSSSSPSLRRIDECSSPSLLPEALHKSPVGPESSIVSMPADVPNVPDLQLPVATLRNTERAPVPEGPATSMTDEGVPRLLSDVAGINVDEEYSRDERLLNEFTKLHPMLSL